MDTLKLLMIVLGILGLGLYTFLDKSFLSRIYFFSVGVMFVRPLGVGDFEFNLTLTLIFLVSFGLLFEKKSLYDVNRTAFLMVIILVQSVFVALMDLNQSNMSTGVILSRAWNWVLPLATFLLVWRVSIRMISTEKDLQLIAKLFIWNCAVFSITAIISFLGFYDGVVILGYDSELLELFGSKHSRIYGISLSNLVFAVTPIAILILQNYKTKVVIKIVLPVIIIIAVLVSLKRIAILALIITIFFSKRKPRNVYLTIILLGIVFIQIFGEVNLITDMISRFQYLFEDENSLTQLDNSSQIRVNRVKKGLESFLGNPLFGVGSGTHGYLHNGIIELFANLGVFALIFLRPLVESLKSIYSNWRWRRSPWSFGIVIFSFTVLFFESAINRVEIMYFYGLFYACLQREKDLFQNA